MRLRAEIGAGERGTLQCLRVDGVEEYGGVRARVGDVGDGDACHAGPLVAAAVGDVQEDVGGLAQDLRDGVGTDGTRVYSPAVDVNVGLLVASSDLDMVPRVVVIHSPDARPAVGQVQWADQRCQTSDLLQAFNGNLRPYYLHGQGLRSGGLEPPTVYVGWNRSGPEAGDLRARRRISPVLPTGQLHLLRYQAVKTAPLGQQHHQDQPRIRDQIRGIEHSGDRRRSVRSFHLGSTLPIVRAGASRTPIVAVRRALPRSLESYPQRSNRWIEAKTAPEARSVCRILSGMGDNHRAPDEDHEVHNDLSGEVHGPVGQFGSVHGDVNMSYSTEAQQDPEEIEFRKQYRDRMQAEWDAEEERRAELKRKKANKERGEIVCGGLAFIGLGIFLINLGMIFPGTLLALIGLGAACSVITSFRL